MLVKLKIFSTFSNGMASNRHSNVSSAIQMFAFSSVYLFPFILQRSWYGKSACDAHSIGFVVAIYLVVMLKGWVVPPHHSCCSCCWNLMPTANFAFSHHFMFLMASKKSFNRFDIWFGIGIEVGSNKSILRTPKPWQHHHCQQQSTNTQCNNITGMLYYIYNTTELSIWCGKHSHEMKLHDVHSFDTFASV